MSELALPIGSGISIKWEGQTYILEPLTLKDFGVIEHECLRRKRDTKMQTVVSLYGKIPDEMFVAQLDKVRAESEKMVVADVEVQEWIDSTRDGLCFTLWLALDRRYPGKFSLERMLEVMYAQVTEEQMAALLAARDQACGLDDAGKDTGSGEVPVAVEPKQ